jgi:hypothetical protein
MTREDIHKLIAGYATGTLTEEERRALFAAALDDQELFDELAREQELKELIDEPGVRERLLASLDASLEPVSRTRAWWDRSHWTWAAAATTAAILLGVYLTQPREPKRLAVMMPQPPPISVAPVPFAEPPPVNSPAPALPAPATVRGSVSPALPPPEPALQKVAEQTSKDQAVAAPRQEAVAEAPPLLKQPQPAAAPDPAARTVTPIPIQPQALTGAGVGGRGGGRGGAVGGFAGNRFVDKTETGFGLDYAVTAEGRLRIVPSANGFLSVSAASQLVISNRQVTAGSPQEIPLPDGAASATIVFSAQSITDSIQNIVKNPMDAASGTISDPNPSTTSRLELVIPIAR